MQMNNERWQNARSWNASALHALGAECFEPLMTQDQSAKTNIRDNLRLKFMEVLVATKELFGFVEYERENYRGETEIRTKRKLPSPDETLAILQATGVSKVDVHFYGGHDSGDVEDITVYTDVGIQFRYQDLFRDIDQVIEPELEAMGGKHPDYLRRRGIRFEEALVDPVWSQYGSFAGDFAVSGNLIYNCAEGTVLMSGQQQTWEDMPTRDCLSPNFEAGGARALVERFMQAMNEKNSEQEE